MLRSSNICTVLQFQPALWWQPYVEVALSENEFVTPVLLALQKNDNRLTNRKWHELIKIYQIKIKKLYVQYLTEVSTPLTFS